MLGVIDDAGELSPGLRRVAKGFKASEGYNLRDLREGRWTPAMKRKVSMYFHELQQLTAQEKIVVQTRSPARLASAQAIGGHDPRFKFKVAFLPGSAKSTLEWDRDNTPIVRERGYSKAWEAFNPERLAVDPASEVKRVLGLKKMRDATTFGIVAGANVMLSEGLPSRKGLLGKIINLQSRYDGVTALKRSSGNYGDAPGAHHWSKWLFGVQAFRFSKTANQSTKIDEIARANKEVRRRKANARKRAKGAK